MNNRQRTDEEPLKEKLTNEERLKNQAERMEEEAALIEKLKKGETIVLNIHRHPAAIAYAQAQGRYKRIDRKTEWGNPFLLRRDGDRDDVCEKYAAYLEGSPHLLSKIATLKGKALGCWCSPLRCHGDTLQRMADESP
jgi:hypothetical protein